jgi:hypothetical protein
VGVLGVSCVEGRVEDCTLTGNSGGGLDIQPGCPLVLENNRAD